MQLDATSKIIDGHIIPASAAAFFLFALCSAVSVVLFAPGPP
jgi:hypothetical protein